MCYHIVLKPTCFCFCLACGNKTKTISETKKERGRQRAKLFLLQHKEKEWEYLLSPADGGVVLQLPVTMSPKLEELPPAFLQKQHNIFNSKLWKWVLRGVWYYQLTFVSAPAWVSLPPVVEGWGWRWCLPLLLLADRSTSHYYTSVEFSATTEPCRKHLFSFNIMGGEGGLSSLTADNHSLLWCAGSLWHRNWLQLLGQDSPHPELHSNSHLSLPQMLQVWTVETINKKGWWNNSGNCSKTC